MRNLFAADFSAIKRNGILLAINDIVEVETFSLRSLDGQTERPRALIGKQSVESVGWLELELGVGVEIEVELNRTELQLLRPVNKVSSSGAREQGGR